RTPSRKRKRQLYADYRELLGLELQAKELNFPVPGGARSLSAQPPILQAHERAPEFQENGGTNGIPAAHATQLNLPNLPPFSYVEQPAILVVDQRMNMFFGSRRNLKSVVAANTAALIAWQMFAQGKRVGAIIFNDTNIAQFEAGF